MWEWQPHETATHISLLKLFYDLNVELLIRYLNT